jgi:hypothetical protein
MNDAKFAAHKFGLSLVRHFPKGLERLGVSARLTATFLRIDLAIHPSAPTFANSKLINLYGKTRADSKSKSYEKRSSS